MKVFKSNKIITEVPILGIRNSNAGIYSDSSCDKNNDLLKISLCKEYALASEKRNRSLELLNSQNNVLMKRFKSILCVTFP